MTVITNAPRLPGEQPFAPLVAVELLDDARNPIVGYVSGTGETVQHRLAFPANGLHPLSPALSEWELELVPNAEIEPAGTVYRITEQRGRGVAAIHIVEVPEAGGPYTVLETLIDEPGSMGSLLLDHLADLVDAHDASAVSVLPAGGLVSTDVQSALAELDARATAEAVARAAADTAEAAARAAAVAPLATSASVTAEASTRAAADTALTTNLAAEVTARTAADTAEASARTAADTTLTNNLAAHGALTTGVHGIADTSALVLASDSRLTDTRTPPDGSVTGGTGTGAKIAANTIVNANIAPAAAIDMAKVAGLTTALSDEATARATAVTAEASTRAAADTTLTNNLAAEVTNRGAAVTAEATARTNADTAEATARAAADTAEAAARALHEAATTGVHGIANTANLVLSSDSRLSDQRTPLDNSVTQAKVQAGSLGIDRLAVDPRARSTHTGTQDASTIADFSTAVRTNRLDQMAAPTGPLSVNGQRVTNGVLPVAASDLITKEYADALRAGLLLKADHVRVMVDTHVNINAPGTVLDTITMLVGDRVLLTGQTSANDNGIYVWNGGAAPMTRAADANTSEEMRSGTAVWISAGTYEDQRWALVTADPITLGVTAQSWSFDGGLAHVTAGDGLTKTGHRLDVGQGTGLEVTADAVGIADGGVDTPQLADDAVTAPKLADDAVDTAAMVDEAVTTDKLALEAVTDDQVATGADIAPAKIAGTAATLGTEQTVTAAKTHTAPLRVRHVESHFDVRSFGGVGSIAEATATFQAAFAEWAAQGGALHLPGGGDFTVNGALYLPQSSGPSIKHWTLDGRWCKLRAAAGYVGVLVGDPLPVDTASVHLGRMMEITRLDLIGDGVTTGQRLLRVVGGQNTIVRHNKARFGDVGIDCVFTLGGLVELNEATANLTYDIMVRAGLEPDGTPLWTGATGPGTAANSTTIHKNRSYGNGGALKAQIAVLAANGVDVQRNICEGLAGEVAVLVDALGNTSDKYVNIDNTHSENFPTVAVLKVKPSAGGRVYVREVKNDLGATLVDGRGANPTAVLEVDAQSLFTTNMFRADVGGGIWRFKDPGSAGKSNPLNTAMWVGGTKPYIRVDRQSNTTDEPGIADNAVVLESYAGGKLVLATGKAIITGSAAPGSGLGNTGDTFVSSAGGLFQKIAGTWVSVPETIAAHGTTGATETVDVAAGTIHTATMDVSCTFTIPDPPTGATLGWSFTLVLTCDGVAAATWPATVRWPSDVAPTLTTAGIYAMSFVWTGVRWRGSAALRYSA